MGTSSGTSGMTAVSGSDVSSGTPTGSEPLTPSEEAAEQACAVHDSQMPLMIPSGEPPYQETGFGLGNEFPHHFIVDTSFVPLNLEDVPEAFVCYQIYPGQDDGQDWWFSDLEWQDADGEVRVYMATSGVDGVVYYSSIPSHFNPTYTPSISYDVSTSCPALPRVWRPDPTDLPEESSVICILPSSDQAEIVFVRVR